MQKNREKLLSGLMALGCVEISEPDRKLNDPDWTSLVKRDTSCLIEVRNQITDVLTALDAIKRYAKLKDGLFIQRKPVSEETFLDYNLKENAQETTVEVLSLLEQISGLQAEETRILADQAALKPWLALDVPLEEIFQGNLDKLKKRYPQGFDTQRSLVRLQGDL